MDELLYSNDMEKSCLNREENARRYFSKLFLSFIVELVSKYDTELKTLLLQGQSGLKFMVTKCISLETL